LQRLCVLPRVAGRSARSVPDFRQYVKFGEESTEVMATRTAVSFAPLDKAALSNSSVSDALHRMINRSMRNRHLGWGLACLLATAARAAGNPCAECHAAISASYARTPMAQSSGAVGSGLIRETFERASFRHAASGFEYRVTPFS